MKRWIGAAFERGALGRGAALLAALALSTGIAAAQGGVAEAEPELSAPPALLGPPSPRPRPDDLLEDRPYKSRARNALIIDLSTGRTLYEKAADRSIPPASMTKLMTLYVALEAVREGRLNLKTRLTVSRHAAETGGSTMHLSADDRPLLEELLHGLIIDSGNDAAIAIAEGVSGSVAAFVEEMNAAAERLRMENSRFRNPTGLPSEGHRMSLYDLATLSLTLMTDHPYIHPVFARRHFTWNGVSQQNRNPLLFVDLSDIDAEADGLKTGYTNEAGYCAVVSALRREGKARRRILAIIAGLPSEDARRREAERAMRWAFAQKGLGEAG